MLTFSLWENTTGDEKVLGEAVLIPFYMMCMFHQQIQWKRAWLNTYLNTTNRAFILRICQYWVWYDTWLHMWHTKL